MNEKTIRFTQHAMKRARERKLWKYVDRKKVFYDAQLLGLNRYVLGECVYVMRWIDDQNYVITMYSKENNPL